MKQFLILSFALTFFVSCKQNQSSNEKSKAEETTPTTFKIAFGSCAHEDKPQPLLTIAKDLNPDVFIYLGDNIYGDTDNMDTLQMKYNTLAQKPEFQALKANTKLLSTWDDHDFGQNDIGKYYAHKKESEKIFLDFWGVPANSERRQHEGIYGSELLEKDGKKVQIIILDTRYFRDDLIHRKKTDTLFKNDYIPNESADSTFLGEAQWAWLETTLKQPADVRIVASSNQFSHEYNGWESWTNVPKEQQKMIDLIKKTKANGVLFISGDVHWGEISKRPVDGGYPIYDVTSSGITQTWPTTEPNKYRVQSVITQNNIGVIEIDFQDEKTDIELALIDSTKQKVAKHQLALSEIQF